LNNLLKNSVSTKTKGFSELKKNDNKESMDFVEGINYQKVDKKDHDLLDIIINSYRKLSDDKDLSEIDFVLSGHEIDEYKRLTLDERARYLVYRYKYNKYPDLKILSDYPPCLQIEPSSICNYRCIMCYQIDEYFSKKKLGYMGYMTIDMFKEIIDQVEGSIEAITLASRGEPLLCNDIEAMLQYSAGKFLGFKINTNASLLTEDMAHIILSNIDVGTVVFSLDTADPAEYEKIRVNGSYEKVVTNISNFKLIKDKYYPSSRIVTRVSGVKLNDSQNIQDMKNRWLQYVDQTGFTKYTPWQSTYTNSHTDINSPCTELWRRMFVWQNGVINPCDYDYKSTLAMGDIRNDTISNIWRSSAYDSLRDAHNIGIRKLKEPCKRCPMI